jgi:hypothetical protein
MFRGPRRAGGPAVGGRRGSPAVPAGHASLAPGHTLPVQATAAILKAAKVKSPIPVPPGSTRDLAAAPGVWQLSGRWPQTRTLARVASQVREIGSGHGQQHDQADSFDRRAVSRLRDVLAAVHDHVAGYDV